MKRKQQNEPPLSESIERRLLHMKRHLTLYPATPDLLYYMLTEIHLCREEIEQIRKTLPGGVITESFYSLQIQVTTSERELHDRLAEATKLDRNKAVANM